MENPSTTTGAPHPFNIVLSGNSNITRGAYLSLYRRYKSQILSGHVTITIVSQSVFHQFYGFFNECITGVLSDDDLKVSLVSYYPAAEIIIGKIVSNDADKKVVDIELQDGSITTVEYVHLVFSKEHFNDTNSGYHSNLGVLINSASAAKKLHEKMLMMADSAARCKDRFHAARILRVVVAGNGASGVELSAAVANTLLQLCRRHALLHVKPTVYLVLNNAALYETVACSRKLEKYIRGHFYELGIRIIESKQVIRVNADGAVLNDGSFISCTLVLNTNESIQQEKALYVAPDVFGGQGNCNNWCAAEPFAGAMPEYSAYFAAIRQGRIIGNNLAASIANTRKAKLKSFRDNRMAVFGIKNGYFIFGKIALTGFWAAMIRYILLLNTIPAGLRTQCFKKIVGGFFTHDKIPKTSGNSLLQPQALNGVGLA